MAFACLRYNEVAGGSDRMEEQGRLIVVEGIVSFLYISFISIWEELGPLSQNCFEMGQDEAGCGYMSY